MLRIQLSALSRRAQWGARASALGGGQLSSWQMPRGDEGMPSGLWREAAAELSSASAAPAPPKTVAPFTILRGSQLPSWQMPSWQMPSGPWREAAAGLSSASAAPAPPKIVPPFTEESARAKVQFAEDAWNSRDPERVSKAYTPDSDWRNRTEFFRGREAIREFLTRKWAKEQGYRLMKELWCYTDNRIAVRFEYEWHDDKGQWYRTHGNELWEFDSEGLMRRRDMSANDYEIQESERRVKIGKA